MGGVSGILYPYQRRWINDKSRFKLGLFARQAGKTFTTTLEIVEDVLLAEALGQRVRWVILSRGERQAKEAMDEGVKLHLRAMGAAFEYFESDFKGVNDATYKQLEIVFPHGSKITALPANPDTARGYSANVFLDEFGFHKDSREIWKALFPVISAPGLKLRVTSTPNGRKNKFYDLATGADTTWSRHKVDIHQAVAEGLDRDIPELRAGLSDEDAWASEYELSFADDADSWLSYDLIASAEHEDAGLPEFYMGGLVTVGVDIAARKDLWAGIPFEEVGDVAWCREVQTRKGARFSEHLDILRGFDKGYRVSKFVMDQTGMGEGPVQDAQDAFGQYRVEGVLMSPQRQLAIVTAAVQMFQDKKVRIPQGDAALRADLHRIQKIVGPTGGNRVLTPRDASGHSDRAWAVFLALAGMANPRHPPVSVQRQPAPMIARLRRQSILSSGINKMRNWMSPR